MVLTDFPNSCPVSGRFLPLDHNISLSGTGFRSMHRYIPHCRYTDSVSLYFHLRRHCQMHHSCKLSQVFLLCLSDDLPNRFRYSHSNTYLYRHCNPVSHFRRYRSLLPSHSHHRLSAPAYTAD